MQDKVKQYLGEQVFAIISLQVQLEKAEKEIIKLQTELDQLKESK